MLSDPLVFIAENIPVELGHTGCILWQLEDHGLEKPSKVPYSVKTGRPCDPTNVNVGVSLALASAAHKDNLTLANSPHTKMGHPITVLDRRGVGFILRPPFIGVDLDDCLDENGNLDARAKDFFHRFSPTYTDISQSFRGLKLIYHGKNLRAELKPVPCYGKRVKPNEVYSHRRYFALTGQRFAGTPAEIAKIEPNIVEDIFRWVETHGEKSIASAPVARSSAKKSASHERQIELFMAGKWEEASGKTDLSVAVHYFLYLLALHCEGDREQVEARFLESKTYLETHWVEKWARLRESELTKAIDKAKEKLDAINIAPGNLMGSVVRSEEVLVKNESLLYFSRSGDLVKPTSAAKDTSHVKRDKRSVTIQAAKKETILRDLGNLGTYRRGLKTCDPPEHLAAHIIDRTRMGESGFRPLDMVTLSPVLAPDGMSVIDKPGTYAQGIYFPPTTAMFPEVPKTLSREVAMKALDRIDAVLEDFPFVMDGAESWDKSPSCAVVMSAILSLVARPALPTVPIHAFSAPSFGAGKTKLAEIASLAALGWKPATHSFENADEFTKALVPILRQGDRSVLIDNIRGVLSGDRFASMVSSEETKQRVLGQSDDVRLLNKTVFTATGVNLVIGDDLCRRTILCSLDPNNEHPENREFDFDPVELATKFHPVMCIGALTALRAYVEAGCPEVHKRALLGSFEEWDRLVVGTLLWCGYGDPVSTQKLVHDNDPLKQRNRELLAAWYREYRTVPVKLNYIGAGGNPVRRLLSETSGGWDAMKVSWRLKKLENQVISGFKLTRHSGRVVSYLLQIINQSEVAELLKEQEPDQNIVAGGIAI